MRRPAASSLLVEHPALPVPAMVGGRLAPADATWVAPRRLSRGQRERLAVQLAAVTSLLAEFDLWPGRRNLARARIIEGEAGLQAVLAGFPVCLSRVYRGLGGGERAADLMRAAAGNAIAAASGVPAAALDLEESGPGFFLEDHLEALLGPLSRPLDPGIAGNLWAERWEVPPTPEAGEALYWRAPSERIACRLAASLWVVLEEREHRAWLRTPGHADRRASPPPPPDTPGVLLLCGRLEEEDLAAAGRWAERPGCAAVAVGLFPAGWRPPPPPGGFDTAFLPLHLALTGAPVQRCREQVERRRGIFDPLAEGDRSALTAAARWLWQPPDTALEDGPAELLAHCLQLLPEGVPESFLREQTGLSGAALARLARAASVVVEGDRWRLPQPAPLRPSPRHRAAIRLYSTSDPRRLRHAALADGDAKDLVRHCREGLSRLEGHAVRELLAPIAPGSLGGEVRSLLVEACLAELDLATARTALQGADAADAAPWLAWLGILDAPARFVPALPDEAAAAAAPRAAGEVALFVYRCAVRTGTGDADGACRLVERCRHLLGGAVGRRFELEMAAIDAPARLEDRAWRRRVLDGHPKLLRRCLHLRGLRLADAGRTAAAKRMLERAMRSATSPGEEGLLHLDLGYLALDDGHSHAAATHLLRALRLLEAAGFEERTQAVLFNLAVCDLDVLQVKRAQRRLDEVERRASGGEDPFVTGERVRLALAVGDEAEFRRRLAGFPVAMAAVDARFEEQLALLRGIDALLGGERRQARRLLAGGGSEGRPWLGLLDALEERPGAAPEVQDHWGLGLTAELLRVGAPARGSDARRLLTAARDLGAAEGLALALMERLLGRQEWIDDGLRRAAVARLEREGLDGWARRLAGWTEAGDAVLAGFAALLEAGGPDELDEKLVRSMLGALGLTGIEVSSHAGGPPLWRWGEGPPARRTTRGRFLATALGGEPSSAHGWRLLLSLLELLLPDRVPRGSADEEATGLYGGSEAMRALREDLRRVAPTGVEVLLLGETGVGKEVAAHALHRLSGRRGRFVPVNAAAMPSALLEAELFGAVRGAYTGADRGRAGLADAAAGGTLFLDEIGDLDPPLQVKLLRFLESREVRPVGSDRFHAAEVRVVAATHHDLGRRMGEGTFRADLYYRLSAMPIHIPPLRRRPEDIPVLRAHFQREAVAAKGIAPCRWSGEADSALARYPWPGNVRELRHVVEVAMVRAAGSTVRPRHLGLEDGAEAAAGRWDDAVLEFRRRFLGAALARNRGNRSATARELGISRQALLYHIRQLGLNEEPH